jgi:hypothetical protein
MFDMFERANKHNLFRNAVSAFFFIEPFFTYYTRLKVGVSNNNSKKKKLMLKYGFNSSTIIS